MYDFVSNNQSVLLITTLFLFFTTIAYYLNLNKRIIDENIITHIIISNIDKIKHEIIEIKKEQETIKGNNLFSMVSNINYNTNDITELKKELGIIKGNNLMLHGIKLKNK